jgi:hypothetical protein
MIILATNSEMVAAVSPLPPSPVSSSSSVTAVPFLARGGGAVKKPKLIPRKRSAPAAAAAAAPSKKKTPPAKATTTTGFPTDAIAGAVAMAMVERVVKKVFVANNISFPAQLAGCIVLFFGLLLADAIVPGSGNAVYQALGPGTTLLTKWLPVFFVPGLAMLPLAPSVGSGMEVCDSLW